MRRRREQAGADAPPGRLTPARQPPSAPAVTSPRHPQLAPAGDIRASNGRPRNLADPSPGTAEGLGEGPQTRHVAPRGHGAAWAAGGGQVDDCCPH